MSELESRYITTRIEEADAKSRFSCGKNPLDHYFRRYAFSNDRNGIARAYVFRRTLEDPDTFPRVLGFYTLSMASLPPALVPSNKSLPPYPVPVALIGRFATDKRVQRKGLGEKLLFDAFERVIDLVDAENSVGCFGVIVDAKDEQAEQFYAKYDFITVSVDGETGARKMLLPVKDLRPAVEDPRAPVENS